jgi:hypothetical protein
MEIRKGAKGVLETPSMDPRSWPCCCIHVRGLGMALARAPQQQGSRKARNMGQQQQHTPPSLVLRAGKGRVQKARVADP